jgi:raffinose/stachyose/melibiose transport system permease protein
MTPEKTKDKTVVQKTTVNATKKKKNKHNLAAIFFLLPLALFYGVFYIYSFYFLISTSFLETSISMRDPIFVGLQNYQLLLTHPQFYRAIFNTLLFAGVAIGAGLTLGFFLAVVLSLRMRGSRIFYALFFLPSLMPMALVASVFGVMFEFRYGTMNTILRAMGAEALAQRWLVDPQWAYGVIIVILVYVIGLPIMHYTANLSTINLSLLEAAVVDGAGTFQMFRLILYPLLRGARKTITISLLLGSFRAFELVYLSTGGGPSGRTEITGTYLYDFATSGMNVGYVSAASVIVLLIALGISFFQITLYNRSES